MEIQVYLDDGRVFKYDVADENKAREHSAAIAKNGYRHNPEVSGDEKPYFEHYPVHRILKIKVVGNVSTAYKDRVSGT